MGSETFKMLGRVAKQLYATGSFGDLRLGRNADLVSGPYLPDGMVAEVSVSASVFASVASDAVLGLESTGNLSTGNLLSAGQRVAP